MHAFWACEDSQDQLLPFITLPKSYNRFIYQIQPEKLNKFLTNKTKLHGLNLLLHC